MDYLGSLDWLKGTILVFLAFFVVLNLVGWRRWKRWRDSLSVEVPDCQTDQPWREVTDLRYIENLKRELGSIEYHMFAAQMDSVLLPAKLEELRNTASLAEQLAWQFFLFGWRKTVFTDNQREAHRQRCRQLDRLWSGNVLLELEDLRVDVQRLERRRQDFTTEQKSEARACDERILELQRYVRDLETLLKRATQRVAEGEPSPHEIKRDTSIHRHKLDVKHEIFEMFGGPMEKKVELLKQRNESKEKIAAADLSEEDKAELLEYLDELYAEKTPKSKPKDDHSLNIIYGDEEKT